MNVLWVILDSLSFSATPFAKEGPDTMPELSSLAAENGLVFTNAYVPGPKSPSSHGAFLSGQLPSQTGMHEASPSFETEIPTIADVLSDTYRSYLISSNPFLFNGLDERFDETTFLNDHDRLPFEGGTNPEEFKWKRGHDSRVERYIDFLFGDGKPVRSLYNGIHYKLRQRGSGGSLIPSSTELDSVEYQSVETMNSRIRSFVDDTTDAFVVANYMDVHPPLNASETAIEQYLQRDSIDRLPVGVSGQQLQEIVNGGDNERVTELYHAAIWDLDRKLTPLIRELVTDDTFVAITADHGNWFRQETGLDEEKLHVPLILFGPDIEASVVDETVNLVQLSATTAEVVDTEVQTDFRGPSLLETDTSQVSITEYIRAEGGGPVNPYGDDHSIRHDVVGIKDGTRVDYTEGQYERKSDDTTHEEEIRERISAVVAELTDERSEPLSYEKSTEKRLKELGYL